MNGPGPAREISGKRGRGRFARWPKPVAGPASAIWPHASRAMP